MTAYSEQRSLAIHEAGHAVMAYLLGARFTKISVVEDDDSYGRVTTHRLPDWFRPDIEINGRTRDLIERRIMVCLADSEAEGAWCRRQPGAPDGWEDRVIAGVGQDFSAAADLGGYMTDGSVPELEAYLEWLRQRVLGWTGRLLSEGETGEGGSGDHPAVVRRIADGDPLFWALAEALADAVQDAGTLSLIVSALR